VHSHTIELLDLPLEKSGRGGKKNPKGIVVTPVNVWERPVTLDRLARFAQSKSGAQNTFCIVAP
jgi:hypothetical protein